MGELIADLFVSLDSCASAVDVGPYSGYAGPELDQWIRTELDRQQLIVLGRVTYEALASLSNGSDQGSRRLTESPKVVVSSTLSEPLEWANTRLIAGDAFETLPAVQARQRGAAANHGQVLRWCAISMSAGLVDRLRLMVLPRV